MTIPAGHIKFSDDGTEAWWVGHKRPPSLSLELSGESDHCCIPPNLDRPCSTCDKRAKELHDAYEWAATIEGWETQAKSRKPWTDVPEANRATMVRALNKVWPCPDCHGSGRHCFEITVEWPVCEPECPVTHPGRTLTVSVVPGMVLPIEYDGDGHDGDHPHVCACETERGWAFFPMPTGDDTVAGEPLPSAAAPGKTAVKLLIHPRPLPPTP